MGVTEALRTRTISRRMRTLPLTVTLVLGLMLSTSFGSNDFEDNEFAEFEEEGNAPVDAEASVPNGVDDEFENPASKPDAVDPDVIEEEEDDEESEDVTVDDDFADEFITEESDPAIPGSNPENQPPPVTPPKPIKAADIPNHLRTNWDSFVIEMIVCSGLLAYFVNFFVGKSKNYKLANAWLTSHRGIFESNFSIVGDDGSGTEGPINGVLMKESENVYALWCSGRTCVEGMLCELKLLKRQCLVAILANMLKPGKSDQLHIRVDMNKEDMDTFVMAVGNKKSVARMAKGLNDLNSLCGEKKSGEKIGLRPNVAVVSEIGEASSAILDSKVLSLLSKNEECLDSIHITDQYTGVKAEPDASSSSSSSSGLKNPVEPLKQTRCIFNVPGKGKSKPEDVEALRPMVQLVFHLIEKIKRVRLSKEAKRKADMNRAKIEESHLKMTHSQRQELAQQRREEKRRADKEKIMNEEDPDKQRRWEEAQYKKDMKKKQPRVKQMKMKAM